MLRNKIRRAHLFSPPNHIYTQKKALQAHKAPKQETEKPIIPKRAADARDAREVARKLIKSGAIQAIQRPLTKQDQTSFKRPKGQERTKRPMNDSPSPSASSHYQPFSSASHADGTDGSADVETSRVHDLYQQFASERDHQERSGGGDKSKGGSSSPAVDFVSGSGGSGDGRSPSSVSSPTDVSAQLNKLDKPRTGNTIYVAGTKVNEEFLRTHFASFGKIVNVSMEIEKNRGFITFAKPESADRAIGEMHNKPAAGVQLMVQLARRQPQIEPINDASSSAAWATLGENSFFWPSFFPISIFCLFFSCQSLAKRKFKG